MFASLRGDYHKTRLAFPCHRKVSTRILGHPARGASGVATRCPAGAAFETRSATAAHARQNNNGQNDQLAATRECCISSSISSSSEISNNFGNEEERLHLRKCRHFVNLTNGIEALPMLHELQLPYSFVRIQSTACEQQNLEALISELDSDLLISLALGHCCLVYDCGSRGRNGNPRALWYGLEFVRYTLSKLWLRRPCSALLRGRNVAPQFDQHIRSFRQSTTRRLKYYAKYLLRGGPYPLGEVPGDVPHGVGGDAAAAAAAGVSNVVVGTDGGGDAGGGCGLQSLRLYGVYRPTDHDDDVSYYVRMLYHYQLPQTPRSQDQERRLQLPGRYLARQNVEEEEQERKGEKQQQQQEGEEDGKEQEQGRLQGQGKVAAANSIASCSTDVYNSGNTANVADVPAETSAMSGQRRAEQRDLTAGGFVALQEVSGSLGGGAQAPGCGTVGGQVVYGTTAADEDDGEAVLVRYGFRIFRRGLSPTEWAAAMATTTAVAAAVDVSKDRL